MYGKGIVRFFLIVMALICGLQFLYHFPSGNVEKKADAYAMKAAATAAPENKEAALKIARVHYLDSVSTETVFSIPLIKKFTYEDLKRQQLALGLDLKGGMSVILQVDLKDYLKGISGESKDPTFLATLDKAEERFKREQKDFISIFGEEWAKVSGGRKLATIFSRNEGLRSTINIESEDAVVLRLLRERSTETVTLTYDRLKQRIDKFGVVQPNVSLDASRDLIVVELPGIDNPERARKFLQASAKLEFWDIYRITDAGITEGMNQADNIASLLAKGDTSAKDTAKKEWVTTYKRDSLGNIIDSTRQLVDKKPSSTKGPILSNLSLTTNSAQGLSNSPAVIGIAAKNKKALISDYLNRDAIRALFPQDLEWKWAYKPTLDPTTKRYTDQYELYAIKKLPNSDKAPLEGDRVTEAGSAPDPQTGNISVSLKMDNAGAKTWGAMTTKAANDNNREIAIVLDGEVVSAPRVINPITTGDSQISGSYSIQEAKDLANILQIGKLPAQTRIIQESLVGPSLGKDNIDRSVKSIFIAFLLLIVFMILYYRKGGIIALIAIGANLFYIIGGLASFGTVLTLPGIAGILLTMATAVDGLVIIYERIREELRLGKTMQQSVADGFKHSASALIDANVTTLLTAFVLAYFGLGPIKGFAVTLIIGIIFSMVTSMLMSRLIIEWWIGKGKSIDFEWPWSKDMFTKVNIDWMGNRKWGYIFSGALMIVGLISFLTRGFELGVDFKGGYSYNVSFAQNIKVNEEAMRSNLTKVFGGTPIVKAVDTKNTYNITTSYLVNETSTEAAEKVQATLFEGIKGTAESGLTYDKFKSSEGNNTHITSSTKVGPLVASDIKQSSFMSTIFALLLIFVYLFFRFNRWQFSFGAVIALLHDVLATLAIFSLFHGIAPFSMEVDQAFIAAILTVIGYSTNDTVIVFDRIREFLHTYTGKSKKEIFNAAINRTLSRTLITSGTLILVTFIMFALGGSSIKGFTFAMFFGVLFGTYSSIFIASALVIDLTKGEELFANTSSTPAKAPVSKPAKV